MTTASKTRDLAHRLLAYEAVAGDASEPAGSATVRVYGKLRQNLCTFVGITGFQLLAIHALAQARTEDPGFSEARVTEDGTLEGLGKIEHQTDFDKGAGGDRAGEAGIILIARLLGLLHILLGEALTLSLLRVTWPGAAFGDHNSENGRKA
jgi:hypothetical protein